MHQEIQHNEGQPCKLYSQWCHKKGPDGCQVLHFWLWRGPDGWLVEMVGVSHSRHRTPFWLRCLRYGVVDWGTTHSLALVWWKDRVLNMFCLQASGWKKIGSGDCLQCSILGVWWGGAVWLFLCKQRHLGYQLAMNRVADLKVAIAGGVLFWKTQRAFTAAEVAWPWLQPWGPQIQVQRHQHNSWLGKQIQTLSPFLSALVAPRKVSDASGLPRTRWLQWPG